jgi:hypothetical protein
MSVLSEFGFEAADAGPLSASRYLEPLAALMTSLDRAAGGRREHALKLLRRPAARSHRVKTAGRARTVKV